MKTSGQRHGTYNQHSIIDGLAVSVDRQDRKEKKTQNMRRWIAETGDDAYRAARVSEESFPVLCFRGCCAMLKSGGRWTINQDVTWHGLLGMWVEMSHSSWRWLHRAFG